MEQAYVVYHRLYVNADVMLGRFWARNAKEAMSKARMSPLVRPRSRLYGYCMNGPPAAQRQFWY